MTVKDQYDKGPTHGFSARGYSAAYEADRSRAEQELSATMAGHPPDAELSDPTLKNPDREFQAPASMPDGSIAPSPPASGPNGAGNSAGDGSIDPQGQQGGTEGGQPGTPATIIGGRAAGTPLADDADRHSRRFDQRGARPIQPVPGNVAASDRELE